MVKSICLVTELRLDAIGGKLNVVSNFNSLHLVVYISANAWVTPSAVNAGIAPSGHVSQHVCTMETFTLSTVSSTRAPTHGKLQYKSITSIRVTNNANLCSTCIPTDVAATWECLLSVSTN